MNKVLVADEILAADDEVEEPEGDEDIEDEEFEDDDDDDVQDVEDEVPPVGIPETLL